MPYCPNPDCDHRKRLGEPAEFNEGSTICSDCGSTLSGTVPHFPVVEKQKLRTGHGWTCPQCGGVNPDDLSLCICGYDVNRPLNPDMIAFMSVSESTPSTWSTGHQPELKLEFNGKAAEYFKIWIVNLCLTLLTFGIFSAWAKVRKKRYFYSHTVLDGTPFQYLGQPIPILKGRVIAAILFLVYYASSNFFTNLLPYVLVAGGLLAPWVVIRSAAFNARYSAFRNMTFHFDAGYIDALKVLSIWGLVPIFVMGSFFGWWGKPAIGAVLAVGLTFSIPWWIRRFKNFIIEHTSFGGLKGNFFATGGQFFKVYFLAGLIMFGFLIATGLSAALLFTSFKKSQAAMYLGLVPLYSGYVLAYAFVQARSSNLVWNSTSLGPLRFQSTLIVPEMVKLYVTNAVAIVISAGLLIPWAVMRTLKYRADHMRVLQAGELTEFEGSAMSSVEAIGAETVDFFDVDISL